MRLRRWVCFMAMLLCAGVTNGRDEGVCVKYAERSCQNQYGAWPGPRDPPPWDCHFVTCVDDYNCTSGEPLVLTWMRLEGDWSVAVATHISPAPNEAGNLMKDPLVTAYCTKTEICDYDCVIEPIVGSKHCKALSINRQSISMFTTDLGECTGGPEDP